MEIRQFDIWIADLNPRLGTESGKVRPVMVIQSNLLNSHGHPSTIICPISSKVMYEAEVLRVHLEKGTAQLNEACDILLDQIRAIDNRRLTRRLGALPPDLTTRIRENIKILLDL
jgi:mRNA interferase MazF